MSIVIATPTGHIGSRVTRRLFDAGKDLTLLVRNPDKLPADVRSKAKIEVGDLNDAAFVARATAGAEALFWLTYVPFNDPEPRESVVKLAGNVADAVRANNIAHVVNLSSFGAQNPTGYGPVSNLHLVETALNETDSDVLHLRPGSFMENFLMQIPTINSMGTMFNHVPRTVALPMVATRDIGDAAADRLLDLSWTGKLYQGVHGPTDLTGEQATAILSEVLGRPLQYVETDAAQTREAFLGMGASPAFADGYIEMMEGFTRDNRPAEPRSALTTTPTTLAAWAHEVMKPMVTAG